MDKETRYKNLNNHWKRFNNILIKKNDSIQNKLNKLFDLEIKIIK
jgi:hypothetical protein